MGNLIIGVKLVKRSTAIEFEKALNNEINMLNQNYKVLDVQFIARENNGDYVAIIKYGYILRQK